MFKSIRKQTESEDIVLELNEKILEEAAEEEQKEVIKLRLSEPSFSRLKINWETFLKVSTDVMNFQRSSMT